MSQFNLIDSLKKQRVIPIFRGSHEEIKSALNLMAPLAFSTIELTTSIPEWQKLLAELSSDFQVGVGTITTNSEIEQAISGGAKFLVSFGTFPELLEANKSVPVIPGALTPSEFLNIKRSGINLAKLYPAANFGAKYLRDLKVLLPEMNFVVTGGIGVSEEELRIWSESGAIAIGMGSALGNPLTETEGFKSRVANLKTLLK